MDSRITERDLKQHLRSAPAPEESPYMRVGEVLKRTGLSSSMLYDLIRAGQFPKWAALAKIALGWHLTEVEAWMAARSAISGAPKEEALPENRRGRPAVSRPLSGDDQRLPLLFRLWATFLCGGKCASIAAKRSSERHEAQGKARFTTIRQGGPMSPKSSGTRPTWPIWLFVATALGGVLSTVATIAYYDYSSKLKEQEQVLHDKQQQYQAEIDDLKKKVVVEHTETQTIAVPVVSSARQCSRLPLLNEVCFNVPQSRIEQRQIPVTTKVEDPAIKAQLAQRLTELNALSATAVTTQATQAALKDLTENVRQLVAPIISLIVSLASLFIILSKKYNAESEKWAFGTLGTILGFWLK